MSCRFSFHGDFFYVRKIDTLISFKSLIGVRIIIIIILWFMTAYFDIRDLTA